MSDRYVRPSEEGPQRWAANLCKEYALYRLGIRTEATIRTDAICGHAARYNTAYKALKDLGLIASATETSITNKATAGYHEKVYHRSAHNITVNGKRFEEYSATIATAPVFVSSGVRRVGGSASPLDTLDEVYEPIRSLSPEEVLWVYIHLDEYDIKKIVSRFGYAEMMCYPKASLPLLANAAYDARICKYLINHRGFQVEVVLGIHTSRACERSVRYTSDTSLQNRLSDLQADGTESKPLSMDSVRDTLLEALAELRRTRKVIRELLTIQQAIRDKGEKYLWRPVSLVKKHLAEEGFRYVNSEDKELKELTKIALEGTYLGYPITLE